MLLRLLTLGVWWLLVLAAPPAWANGCATHIRVTEAHRAVWLGDLAVSAGTVALPDTLDRRWRHESFRARYTLDVRACTVQAGRGLWLFRIGAPYRLSVDGVAVVPELPRIGSATAKALNGRTPMLFALPQGAREVQIDLVSMPYIPAGVARAGVGPMTVLLPEQLSAYNQHSGGMYIVSLITVVVGLGTVMLWRTRRHDDVIFWFSMMCLTWGIRGTMYAGDAVHLPILLFEQINPFMVSLFAVSCVQTTLLLLGKQTRTRHRTLMGVGLGFAAAFVLTLSTGHGAWVFRALSFLVGLLMLGVMPFLLWSGRSVLGRWRAGLMALGFVTMFGASMNDVLIVAGTLPPDQTSFILLGFSTVLLAYALVCAEYVMRTLNQAETSNEMLEARMREKSRELEHSYALLRESERASARAQERARFNREIHDGLGAQLITALRGVERDALNKAQVVQTLQEGLDELRLLMDSSDLGRSLHGALVSWRNRWDARLQAIGLQLQWSVSDDLEALELGSDATLQLMRVLQESVTNTIKHASAHHISVRAWRAMGTQPTLELEIQDDGQGLPDQAGRPNGRGLRHMAQRAERLGARLVVDNAPPPQRGTRVRLSLPWPEGDFRSSDTAPLTT